MKKVGNPKSFSKTFFSLALTFVFAFAVSAQEPAAAPAPAPDATAAPAAGAGDPAKGKELFNTNCAACHKLDQKMTGPALRGVGDKYDKEWLYKWIHNSADLIKSGDAKAVKVYEEFNKVAMTAFPQLSNADIDNIIAYTMQPKEEPAVAKTPGTEVGGSETDGGFSNTVILGALVLVLAVLIFMLITVNKLLRNVIAAKGIEFEEKPKSLPLWKAFAQNQFLVLVSAILFLLVSAYYMYGYFMQIGVDLGCRRIIKKHYSHKIHA